MRLILAVSMLLAASCSPAPADDLSATYDGRFADLELRLDSLEQKIQAMTGVLSAELERRIGEVSSASDAGVTQANTFENRFAYLQSQIDDLSQELDYLRLGR